MTNKEKLEIEKKRELKVFKANEIIQKSRFDLSVTEQKTLAYICSMIKPRTALENALKSDYQLEYEFNIREYCKVCGIFYDSGRNYAMIKETLKSLSDRSFWVEFPNGDDVLMRFISKVRSNKHSGKAFVRIDEDMVPYLFDLGQKFTAYQLRNILGMKSAYSIRIYELMKSYEFRSEIEIDLQELKRLLDIENVKSYEKYHSIKQKILDIAVKEIDDLSDINISYEPMKKSNKVVSILFRIKKKETNARIMAEFRTNEIIDPPKKSIPGQMNFGDLTEMLDNLEEQNRKSKGV